MKKACAALALIALSALIGSAAEIKSEALSDRIDRIDTILLPATLTSLASLDLVPGRAPNVSFAAMNLDPRQAALDAGHRYLNQGIRAAQVGDTLYDASLLAMIALNVADYISTTQAMKFPALAEGNPLLKPFAKSPAALGAVKAGIAVVGYLSFKSLYKRNKPLAWVLSTAANLALSYAVSNNYRLIGTMKGR